MLKIVKEIWIYILTTWTVVCNGHLHRNAAQMNLPNCKQAVTMLYEQWHQLPLAAQIALYWQSLETILDYPAPQIQTWITQSHDYFNQQLKAAKRQAILWMPDIRNLFGPPTQQTTDLQPPWETLLHCTSVGLLCHSSLREITLKMLRFLSL